MIINFLQSIVRADEHINSLLYVSRNASAIKLFTGITLLGEISTIILLTLATSIILWINPSTSFGHTQDRSLRTSKKWQILGLLFSVVGSAGTTLIAKMFFDRPRPLNGLIIETSASFPSGHATIAVAFYGFIVYLLIRGITNHAPQGCTAKEERDRLLIALFSSILILAIGFSRLYLGVHYVSDVLVGYLVGGLWLIISIKLIKHFSIQK